MWWALGAIWLVAAIFGFGYARYCWQDYLRRYPREGVFHIKHTVICCIFALLGPLGLLVAIKKKMTEGYPIRFWFNKKSTT